MNNGFIVIWRKFMDTSFYRDSYAVHLALHLILEANHEPKKFTFNRKEEVLERGQLLTGRKVLSTETGISESTIRHKLELLENISFLTRKTTNKFTIITICNYNRYQDKKEKIDQPSTNQVPTKDQPSTTNNNITIKQEKNIYTSPVQNPKIKHLDFVMLTTDEHSKLKSTFGDKLTEKYINDLNIYIGSKGKKYKSHYFTILNWARNDKKDPEFHGMKINKAL